MKKENDYNPTSETDTSEEMLDGFMRKAVADVAIPSDLETSILANCETVFSPPRRILFPTLIGIAALLAVAIVSIFILIKTNDTLQPELTFRNAAAQYINDARFLLDHKASDLTDVRQWLSNQSAPNAGELPLRLSSNQVIGCKELQWRGHPISLICFRQADGKLVHLFVTPRNSSTEQALASIINTNVRAQGLATISWQTTEQLYLLTGSDPEVNVSEYLEI